MRQNLLSIYNRLRKVSTKSVKLNNNIVPIYEYDTDTFKMLDYTQYYSNLTKVILEDKILYEKHYSFKDSYKLEGLEVCDFKNLYLGIKNGSYFNNYCEHYTPGFSGCETNNILLI